jgi:carbon-monoxide dehydrogenase medium subunit/6-hydroxypseudooxynicotine dehydrogenase subunit alpha
MKPAPFEYAVPETLDDALATLAEHADDAKILAGGQSLVPMLNFRLARPERLIDINRLASLSYIRRSGGVLRIGALTRHVQLERSSVVARHWPLLTEAVKLVAHGQIRNRGTVGGSVTHADPAAELPVAFAALDARFHVRSVRGARSIAASDLFVTHLTTSLEADELLTEIEVPPLPPRTGSAFVEYARRHGDFALGGAAVVLTLDEDAAAEIAELAVVDITPTGDIHGSREYRHGLIEALVRRALVTATARATQEAS